MTVIGVLIILHKIFLFDWSWSNSVLVHLIEDILISFVIFRTVFAWFIDMDIPSSITGLFL